MDDKFVVLGRVSGLFGVRGWVKVYSHTRPRANLARYERWFLRDTTQDCHAQWRSFRVLAAKPHGKTLVAQLATIDGQPVADRDAAAALLDADIGVARADMPALPAGEFYWHDLLELSVVNREQETLGRVTGLLETGANDVLRVRGEVELLIPFVMGVIVDTVDLEAGVIHVDWGRDY